MAVMTPAGNREPTTSARTRKQRIATLLVAVTVGGCAAVYGSRLLKPRAIVTDGVVLSIDPENRTGTLRVVHPKTGEPFELQGALDPNCEIRIEDRVATIERLQPGDVVHAEGLLYRFGSVVATRLTVIKPEDSGLRDVGDASGLSP